MRELTAVSARWLQLWLPRVASQLPWAALSLQGTDVKTDEEADEQKGMTSETCPLSPWDRVAGRLRQHSVACPR